MAWERSRSASGLERLKLIHQAFPHAVSGAGCGLNISYAPGEFSVSDLGGFLTLIDSDDTETLFSMVGMESGERGSVRHLLTGKNPFALRAVPVPKPEPKKKLHLTLGDLGI